MMTLIMVSLLLTQAPAMKKPTAKPSADPKTRGK
jgi:hypothetical protein